jgi:phosphoribosylformylglycinamidine cyclo-ligase
MVATTVAILEKHHHGTRRIGSVTDQPGRCTAPGGVVLQG